MFESRIYSLVIDAYKKNATSANHVMRTDEAVAMAAQIAFDEACRYFDQRIADLEKRVPVLPSRSEPE